MRLLTRYGALKTQMLRDLGAKLYSEEIWFKTLANEKIVQICIQVIGREVFLDNQDRGTPAFGRCFF
jgi:hypothetical protein